MEPLYSMCWNAEVSLNTFLFSSFVLGLVIYNNLYTQYKIPEIDNLWFYIFMMLFISVQLIEYFIWRNINNKYYNNIFSIIVTIVFILLPMSTMMMISDISVRFSAFVGYFIFMVYSFVYRFDASDSHTALTPKGHLRFFINKWSKLEYFIWVVFFLFAFFYIGKWWSFLFGVFTFLITLYSFYTDKSSGSMWCWVVNSFFIGAAFYILFYLPFFENGKLKDFC